MTIYFICGMAIGIIIGVVALIAIASNIIKR